MGAGGGWGEPDPGRKRRQLGTKSRTGRAGCRTSPCSQDTCTFNDQVDSDDDYDYYDNDGVVNNNFHICSVNDQVDKSTRDNSAKSFQETRSNEKKEQLRLITKVGQITGIMQLS